MRPQILAIVATASILASGQSIPSRAKPEPTPATTLDVRDFASAQPHNYLIAAGKIFLRNNSRSIVMFYLLNPAGTAQWTGVSMEPAQEVEVIGPALFLAIGTNTQGSSSTSIRGLNPFTFKADRARWNSYDVQVMREKNRYEVCYDATALRWTAQAIPATGCHAVEI